jgi:hypothetical protein
LFQGPGATIGFATSRATNNQQLIQFTFTEDVILNGMIISTVGTNYLQSFRLRANVDKRRPYLLDGSVFQPGTVVCSKKLMVT